jgi:hypothetical protein
LTRAQGAALALPLLFEYLQQNRRLTLRSVAGGWPVVLPAFGWLAFMAYTVWLTGGEAPGSDLQQFWGYQVAPPWDVLAASWTHIMSRGDVVEAFNLFALLAFTVGAAVAAIRLPFAYTLFMVPQLVLLWTRVMFYSPLMSVSRYVVVLFPVFVVLAVYSRRSGLRHGIAVVLLLPMALFFFVYVHWGFVA